MASYLKRQKMFPLKIPPKVHTQKNTKTNKEKTEKLDPNSTPTSTAEQIKYWPNFFQ